MPNKGLSDKEVLSSRELNGSNTLTTKTKESFIKMFVESLGDPIIRILLIVLGIKTLFLLSNFDWYETVGIAVAIFVASFISTISEYGSEAAFKRLQQEASQIKGKVYRSGQLKEVPIGDIVCNDTILLQSGDRIPADAKIIEGSIWVDEASINGESKEKIKKRGEMIYLGSIISNGEATALVTAVGDKTVYGKIALELQDVRRDSPLKIRLRNLSLLISKFGYLGALLVALAYLFHVFIIKNAFHPSLIFESLFNGRLFFHHLIHAITLAVTIIVVSVPEGLPMMITIVLSYNMKRMLKDHVLVRKLVGIETSGNINILFTDKTGTLTTGKMKVHRFLLGNGKEIELKKLPERENLFHFIHDSLVYNNDAILCQQKIIMGNTTDKSLLEYIVPYIKERKVKKEKILPFDSNKKMSITKVDQHYYIKGAPEKIIPLCKYYLDEKGIKRELSGTMYLNRKMDEQSLQSIRLVALAILDENRVQIASLGGLTLIGIVGLKDQVRKEVAKVVKSLKEAAVKVVMLTGDSKLTAIAIGKEALELKDDDIVLTSEELSTMKDDDIKKVLPKLKIVARALPSDKSRLIKLSQELNLVVGMTGDGVNDAAALKKADVSFAMGSGTEVAKEASDIVILDDNFLSVHQAILYGRTIFKSIRKFIIFQLTINLCAVLLSVLGPFIGIKDPITVIQMLWINMVMDTFAAIAFAGEPAIMEYMLDCPKPLHEPIINRYMYHQIIGTGFYSLIIFIFFLKYPFFKSFFGDAFMTSFFALFIFTGIFHAFNSRTHRLNLFSNLFRNRSFVLVMLFVFGVQLYLIYFGGQLFRVVGMKPLHILFVLLLSSTVLLFDFLRKMLFRKKWGCNGV